MENAPSDDRLPVYLKMDGSEMPDDHAIMSALSSNLHLMASKLQEQVLDGKVQGASEGAELGTQPQEMLSLSQEIACNRIDALLLAKSTDSTSHTSSEAPGTSGTNEELLGEYMHPASQKSKNMSTCPDDNDQAKRLPNDGTREASSITVETTEREKMATRSHEERMKIHHGEKLPTETLLEELHFELAKIPSQNKRALLNAQREFPFLCCSSRHAILFLKAEGFNASAAAKRMARYWEKRAQLYGNLAFSPGTFTKPCDEDQLHL